MTASPCPQCGFPVQSNDRFCSQCGTVLHVETGDTPVLTESEGFRALTFSPVERVPGRHRSRRRRRRIIGRILLGVLVLALIGSGYVAYRIDQTLNKVHSVSEPPADVDASILGGTPGTAISSGPALTAIATYSQQPSGQSQAIPTQAISQESAGKMAKAISGPSPIEGLAQDSPTPGKPVTVPDTVQLFLLMGVDARPGESIDIGVRPDSLAVAAYDTASGSCRLLSIQRDSRVELPGYGFSKINHALAVGGIPYEMLVVEQFLGVKIDHYALIDFSGMESLINKIGGVDVVVTDEEFSIDGYTFNPGAVHLNGKEALAFSRYRYGPDGDFGRIRRQHQVIAAAIDKLASSSAPSMAKLVPDSLDSLAAHLRTDLSAGELTDLGAAIVEHCSNGRATDETIQGSTSTFLDPLLNMDLWYLTIDEADRDRKVQWLVTGAPLEDAPVATPTARIEGVVPRATLVTIASKARPL